MQGTARHDVHFREHSKATQGIQNFKPRFGRMK
jgi:hypothetical protein